MGITRLDIFKSILEHKEGIELKPLVEQLGGEYRSRIQSLFRGADPFVRDIQNTVKLMTELGYFEEHNNVYSVPETIKAYFEMLKEMPSEAEMQYFFSAKVQDKFLVLHLAIALKTLQRERSVVIVSTTVGEEEEDLSEKLEAADFKVRNKVIIIPTYDPGVNVEMASMTLVRMVEAVAKNWGIEVALTQMKKINTGIRELYVIELKRSEGETETD